MPQPETFHNRSAESTARLLLVYITKEGVVIPKDEEASTEGFDFTEVYCLGCSWHGSPKRLIKF